MAKKSKIVKNDQRRAVVARYAERRAELKRIIRSPISTVEQRLAAQRALTRQPRDASPVRLRNRDAVDGRPRGHLRKFGLSRVRVREMAHDGQLPGIRKASWRWPASRNAPVAPPYLSRNPPRGTF
jgi:small subunit ribosomal protein S14